MRWSVVWVGDGAGIGNAKVSIGMTVLEPGHSCPAVGLLCLVVEGEAITGGATLGHLDGLYLVPGETALLRNNGPRVLRLLRVDVLGRR
jgi:hypothetical protein